MQIDLTGKTVLVTGASRGIGRSLAEGLAGAGATVAAHFNQSRNATEALVDALGHGAHAFQADLAESASCERLFASVVETHGRFSDSDLLRALFDRAVARDYSRTSAAGAA